MADPTIYDEDSSIITDMDGGAIYDEGPLEISVHDCGETEDVPG